MNKKGQSIMSEYVMIFFMVIAAVAAMTVYVQRGFEARIHDARNYMIDSVINSSACDANCMQAAGGNIFYEYEPYYALTLASTQHNDKDSSTSTNGAAISIGAIYTKYLNEDSNGTVTSTQAPPCASANPVPLWCH